MKNGFFYRLISHSPDVNVINEKDDIIVITTTVSSDPDFKFAFEIPKDLEIKVAVAEGFSNGAKHYTDIVTSLNDRFNVTQFMTNHRAAPIKRRDVIKQHDYDAIKEYIIDKSISSPVLNESEPEPDGPPLPPRFPIKSDTPPTSPPKVPERPLSKRKNSAPEVEIKPVVARRPRSVSQNQYDSVHSPPLRNSVHVPQRRSIVPKDPSLPEVKDGEHENATIPASSPIVPQQTDYHPKSQTERKDNKPSPPPKPFKNPTSTNRHPTIANNPLQAELKEVMKIKRSSLKSPISPAKQDENSKYPQTSSETSNSEKETFQPKKVKSPVKVPGGTAAPADTQTATTRPSPPSQANENENTQSEAQRKCPKLPSRQWSIPEDCSSNSEGKYAPFYACTCN